MAIITQEMLTENFIKEIVKQFKKDFETTVTGEDLSVMMWDNVRDLGEIFYNKMFEHIDEDQL